MNTPRIAESIDDLRAGQVVATICSDGSAGECITFYESVRPYYSGFMRAGTVVILSDPPPDPVPVPRELVDALAEAMIAMDSHKASDHAVIRAARALVDAARGDDGV